MDHAGQERAEYAGGGMRGADAPGAFPHAGVARPRRHSVRAQVLEALRAALISGELEPGEVYSAPVLGARLGVSATPVREAMQQLAGEGAVEVVPNRGFRVARRSLRDLVELLEVRAMTEVAAVLRLARAVPHPGWDTLRPLAAASVEAAARGDRGGYADADLAFHGALMALTGNSELVRVTGELHRRSQWPVAGAPPARAADLLAHAGHHEALLDALALGDLATAERVAHEHLATAPSLR